MPRILSWMALAALLLACGCGSLHDRVKPDPPVPPLPSLSAPSSSSSMAIDSLGHKLWVANPEAGTVTLLSVENDQLVKGAEVRVEQEPECLALSPDEFLLYVTNRASGTVSVLNAFSLQTIKVIPVGTEPVGCALTPFGDKLYVACSISNTVAVIDTASRSVASVIPVTDGYFPFAVAVTPSKAYVTQFFAQLPPGVRPALTGDTDRGRVGKVTVIDTASDTVLRTVVLNPAPTGFDSNRSSFGGPTTSPTFAFPNLLNTIVVRANRGYVVNGAQSPDGPVNFTTNEQSFISVFDTVTDSEVPSQTVNMNAAVKGESPAGVFLNTPWGLAFSPKAQTGLALSAASDVAVVVTLSANGAPSVTAPAGGVIRIATGKNPRGVVVNPAGTRAYVQNRVSRDVTAINLGDNTIVGTIQVTDLPAPGTLAASVLRGQELFNTSRGVSSVATATPGRMSTNGWGSCFSCHPFGWTDTVVWNFGDGPRKTIPLNSTFGRDPSGGQRILNYSATRDEVEDFELNIRLVSSNRNADGSTGLIIGVPRTDIPNLTPKANAGRSADWTDVVNYVRSIRSPISPLRGTNVQAGRIPFATAGCAACHAGPRWTSSLRTYTPPPTNPPISIVNGELAATLRQVDTFVAGEVNDVNTAARGAAGFNPPSLLGFWAFPPFFHNGQASSLDEVLTRVLNVKAHKDAGVPGRLEDAATRVSLGLFLLSIDDSTTPEIQQ